MTQKTVTRIVVYSAVLILTFLVGFVTGGIRTAYDPEDCNRAVRDSSGEPAAEQNTREQNSQ